MQATNSYRFEGIARALSAISHLGDSTGGTTAIFRREGMLIRGKRMDIPVISGNSYRGILRDKGMLFMLKELGIDEETAVKLTVPAFHFLTSGGALSKDTGRGIDIGEERRLRELIPLVGVFGGATGRNIAHGKMYVGKWYPICRELIEFLPEKYQSMPEAELSIFDMTDVHSFTRMDDAKSYRWQQFLPEPQRELLASPKTKTAKDGTEIAEKPGTAQQMRYSQEVLVAGTKFYCWLQLNDVTEMEKAALASALFEWSKTPFIGGQARHGCGLVDLNLKNWMSVSPLARMQSQEADISPSDAYVEHLHTQKQRILDMLKDIA